MARYVIIKTGKVVNVVDWDGVTPWSPPSDGSTVAPHATAGIGWDWNNGTPTDPTPPPAPPPPPIDLSNADNLEKALKAVLLAAAGMTGKTPAQAKSAFLTAWQALP